MIFLAAIVLVLGLGLGLGLGLEGLALGETIIDINGTENNISQTRQHELAAQLYDFARCDTWEGNNTRDCTITISRIEDGNGNTGSLTIPGTMSLNITWFDH